MPIMRIISHKKIIEFSEKYPDSEDWLHNWYSIVSKTEYQSFADLRKTFPSADIVDKFTVFNVKGNHYRLITAIHYNTKTVYIRNILTHSEYDKNKWRND